MKEGEDCLSKCVGAENGRTHRCVGCIGKELSIDGVGAQLARLNKQPLCY